MGAGPGIQLEPKGRRSRGGGLEPRLWRRAAGEDRKRKEARRSRGGGSIRGPKPSDEGGPLDWSTGGKRRQNRRSQEEEDLPQG